MTDGGGGGGRGRGVVGRFIGLTGAWCRVYRLIVRIDGWN